MDEKILEELESKYLKKYYHFLKFSEEDILRGLNTKNKIKAYWADKWNVKDKNISEVNIGAERIIYSFINSKLIGEPNSCPVGSDLMFETHDAFIHIDLKTVQSNNINDFRESIFVGNNQISYNGTYIINGIKRDFSHAKLPHFYDVNGVQKPCLTYFISILHDEITFETLCIYIASFPNGYLKNIYHGDVFKAGKNQDKVRFDIKKCRDFKIANGRRVLIIYLNKNMNDARKKKLEFMFDCYNTQNAI